LYSEEEGNALCIFCCNNLTTACLVGFVNIKFLGLAWLLFYAVVKGDSEPWESRVP